MNAPFLIRGDALSALANIPEAPPEDRLHGMLWGVDLTECDDPAPLRARLGGALTEPPKWGNLTLTWNDVAESTLHEARARESL